MISPPVNPPTAAVLSALAAATDRLLATVDSLSAADFAAPSTLPGWSRAHVLAHLALNAKGLAGVLTTLGQPQPLPMYPSASRRDSDIDQLAAQAPAHIADRAAVGAAVLAQHLGAGPNPEDALEAVGAAGAEFRAGDRDPSAPQSRSAGGVFARAAAEGAATLASWTAPGTFERTPAGPVVRAAEIPFMRWREVEIHHADLGFGYGPGDWPGEFTSYLLATAAYDRDGEQFMTLCPTDGLTFELGPLGIELTSAQQRPEIRGTAADLAWWLIGRGSGDGLTVTGAEGLPALGPWVRR